MILFKKIKSFTLFEMIVVMLISGLLIGGIYWVFTSNEKLFRQTLDLQTEVIDKTTLFYVLQSDIKKASDVSVSRNKLEFNLNYPGGLAYSFEDEYIVRIFNSRADTFAISGLVPEFYQRTEKNLILYLYDVNTSEKYPLIKYFDWSNIVNTQIQNNGNRTPEN